MQYYSAVKNGKSRTISVPKRFLLRLGQWIDGDGKIRGYENVEAYLISYGYSDIKRIY